MKNYLNLYADKKESQFKDISEMNLTREGIYSVLMASPKARRIVGVGNFQDLDLSKKDCFITLKQLMYCLRLGAQSFSQKEALIIGINAFGFSYKAHGFKFEEVLLFLAHAANQRGPLKYEALVVLSTVLFLKALDFDDNEKKMVLMKQASKGFQSVILAYEDDLIKTLAGLALMFDEKADLAQMAFGSVREKNYFHKYYLLSLNQNFQINNKQEVLEAC